MEPNIEKEIRARLQSVGYSEKHIDEVIKDINHNDTNGFSASDKVEKKQMNYHVHLSTLFTTPELAEAFMSEVIRQLNDVTFNGSNKIDKVTSSAGSVIIHTPEFKKCNRASYYFSPCKTSQLKLEALKKERGTYCEICDKELTFDEIASTDVMQFNYTCKEHLEYRFYAQLEIAKAIAGLETSFPPGKVAVIQQAHRERQELKQKYMSYLLGVLQSHDYPDYETKINLINFVKQFVY